MPEKTDITDDAFRHLIGLVKAECRRDPKREKTLREILIHRDPKHARLVLEEMGQKDFRFVKGII